MRQGTVPEPLAEHPFFGGLIAFPWHVLDRPSYLTEPFYLTDWVFSGAYPCYLTEAE